jgi:hypothetical protein
MGISKMDVGSLVLKVCAGGMYGRDNSFVRRSSLHMQFPARHRHCAANHRDLLHWLSWTKYAVRVDPRTLASATSYRHTLE